MSRCLCLLMWALYLCKRMLPEKQPFLKDCRPVLVFNATAVFIGMEIKSYKTESNTSLVGGLEEHYDQTHADRECKNKEFSHGLWVLTSTKKSAANSHTHSTFCIKEVSYQTRARGFSQTLVLHLLKQFIFQSHYSLLQHFHLLIYWPVV